MSAKLVPIDAKKWAKFRSMIHPKAFGSAAEKHYRTAMTFVAAKVVARIVRDIDARKYTKNRPMTKFIKQSSKPLVQDSDLRSAFTWRVLTPFVAEVGVIKGDPVTSVALTLHEGTTINVTDKMRGMFQAIFRVSQGKMSEDKLGTRAKELWDMNPGPGWRPLSKSTSALLIPGRFFIRSVLADPDLLLMARKTWMKALKLALKSAAGGAV